MGKAGVAWLVVVYVLLSHFIYCGERKSCEEYSIPLDKNYCSSESASMLTMARNMTHFPSTKALEKTMFILNQSKKFSVYMPNKIFDGVSDNVMRLLRGVGVTTEKKRSYHISMSIEQESKLNYIIENSYIGALRNQSFCHRAEHRDCTRIVIQSEQLWFKTKTLLSFLMKCHKSPNCVIWDFSDYNAQWAEVHLR
jgi:hypothetical protein